MASASSQAQLTIISPCYETVWTGFFHLVRFSVPCRDNNISQTQKADKAIREELAAELCKVSMNKLLLSLDCKTLK